MQKCCKDSNLDFEQNWNQNFRSDCFGQAKDLLSITTYVKFTVKYV